MILEVVAQFRTTWDPEAVIYGFTQSKLAPWHITLFKRTFGARHLWAQNEWRDVQTNTTVAVTIREYLE